MVVRLGHAGVPTVVGDVHMIDSYAELAKEAGREVFPVLSGLHAAYWHR